MLLVLILLENCSGFFFFLNYFHRCRHVYLGIHFLRMVIVLCRTANNKTGNVPGKQSEQLLEEEGHWFWGSDNTSFVKL